jgi:hypothetical protein
MTRHARALHWVLVGGWVLIMPPVPLGTSLPPITQWTKLGTYKTSDACETAREVLRDKARHTVGADPHAHATVIAAALGQLQSKCVETKDPEPAAPPKPAPPAATP